MRANGMTITTQVPAAFMAEPRKAGAAASADALARMGPRGREILDAYEQAGAK